MKFKVLVTCVMAWAVTAFAGSTVMDNYIQQAMDNNLALQQKEFSLQKSLAALKEARGMFLPSVGINARYSRAGGGRIIDFPVGDLVNPIHNTLNQLIGAHIFPGNLRNEHIPFLRAEEQDTKVRLVQPVFQPAIYYNYKLKSDLSRMEQASRAVFIRQLVAEIKTAYLNYCKTVEIVKLMNDTEGLLQENVRVSESLYNNQMATKEVVYRARAELSDFEGQKLEAQHGNSLAASYLNFLLNRPLDESIEEMSITDLPGYPGLLLEDAKARAMQNREELQQLSLAIRSAADGVRISQTSFLPNLFLVLDYGIQGEEYRFTQKDDYWMGSAVAEWNLFNGFQDQAKTQQAALEKKKLETQLQEVKKQIELQVQDIYGQLQVAQKAILSAREQQICADKSFQIVNKKYTEGMAPHIEFIDARTAKTRAELNVIVTKMDYQIAVAELEKIVGLYPILNK
jgi:outer membrane protein